MDELELSWDSAAHSTTNQVCSQVRFILRCVKLTSLEDEQPCWASKRAMRAWWNNPGDVMPKVVRWILLHLFTFIGNTANHSFPSITPDLLSKSPSCSLVPCCRQGDFAFQAPQPATRWLRTILTVALGEATLCSASPPVGLRPL